ncbi:MAG: hypothetical protein UY50_C0004G0010 [Parcubacteria group bacterium GW2011_GWA2_49_9]|nr:MAG: hypothetical protein UY50_C0004G0010 [Parcubacteria group bacterium GW2011_GWA2_49_9]
MKNTYTQQFLGFVKTLPLNLDKKASEFNYTNPVLILADAVLSMNRKYEAFVVPRIKHIEKSNIVSLNQLNTIITQGGIESFAHVWNYSDPKRVEILLKLTQRFLKLKEQYGLSDDLETLHKWGKEAKPKEWVMFGVKGIAFTTFQYLRILCGGNTIKPDIHIKRAFLEAVGKNRPLEEIVEVIEETATYMNLQAKQLDYALWSFYSKK